jgi:hypothetical protein
VIFEGISYPLVVCCGDIRQGYEQEGKRGLHIFKSQVRTAYLSRICTISVGNMDMLRSYLANPLAYLFIVLGKILSKLSVTKAIASPNTIPPTVPMSFQN